MNLTRTIRTAGVSDATLTLTGSRTVTAGGLALGGLLRSSGDSIAIGIDRSSLAGAGLASLHVTSHLTQLGRASSLTAFGIRDTTLRAGADSSTVRVTARVVAAGGLATAIGVDRSTITLDGGDDAGRITAEITGCAAPGSLAVAVRDSWIGLNDGADRLAMIATGPNAHWGIRAAIRGRDGADVITGIGLAEDVLINGFEGDDRVILDGAVRSTGATFVNSEAEVQSYGRVGGGPGYDVLELRHLSAAQFQAQMRPIEGGFTLGQDATRYLNFERVVFGCGAAFDVTGVGL